MPTATQTTISSIVACNRSGSGVTYRVSVAVSGATTSNKDYLFNQWLNEDGGRLNQKRNRGLVKNVPYEEIEVKNTNFAWVSFYQIDQFIKQGSIVNPHLARLIYLTSS